MTASGSGSAENVALSTRFFYGFGSVAEGTKNTVFNVFLLFYYNNVLGLPGTLTGAAIFLALCVDAITDPLIGSFSDNFRSRLGRRHPFMYAAVLPMPICFWLLLNPPDLGQTQLFIWLTVFAIGVRASMTLYSIPSGSMVAELTSDYDERTSLVSWRFMFGWIGGLTASQIGYLYYFPNVDGVDGRLDPEAYAAFGAVCAFMVFAGILVCSLGTHRLIPTLRKPSAHAGFSFRRFAGEVRQVLSNRSYRMLVVGSLFASVAAGFNDVVNLYINTYFWEFTSEEIALIVAFLLISIVMGVGLARPIAQRYDKRSAAVAVAAAAILFGPLLIFLRLAGLMPPNRDPLVLYLVIAHAVVLVAAVIAISIWIGSMIADVVDQSELVTGERQEGLFVSAIAFTTKATSGIGGLMAGIMIDVIQFPTGAEAGLVDPDKIYALGLVVGPGLMVLFLLTLVFLRRYEITREVHQEVLDQLRARQSVAS